MTLIVSVRRAMSGFNLDVSFSARAGITALVGPSGAGKTLTLRAIAGLLRPDAGRVELNGVALFDADAHVDVPTRLRNVGYVFQQYALFPHLTVAKNVGYGLSKDSTATRTVRVNELLEQIGLSAFGDRLPGTLSGGQQQRVALARALAPRPAALLLDEPFSALDAPLRSRLADELRLVSEHTRVPMIMVTHDPYEAERLADQIITLAEGSVRLH